MTELSELEVEVSDGLENLIEGAVIDYDMAWNDVVCVITRVIGDMWKEGGDKP